MKNNLRLISLSLFASIVMCFTSNAQNETILSQLAAYKVTSEVLTMAFNEDWPNMSFERHIISTTPGSDYVYKQVAKYNSSQPQGSKWTLISVDDKAPKNYNLKDFKLSMNSQDERTVLLVDQASMKIVKDDATHLVVSFKYVPNSIPENYAFLVDCTSTLTINKTTGLLEKLDILNDGPTKLVTLKLSLVKFDIQYNFNTDLNQYVITRYEYNNTGSYLGATASNNSITDYSNFVSLK